MQLPLAPQHCLKLTLALAASTLTSDVAAQQDLFSEDFEGVTLQPTVTFESEIRERNAWQTVGPDGPAGWTENNLTTSVGDTESGVLEFEGWRFVDKEWWVNTAGGQERELFLGGVGIVAVADPDEWDDFGNPDQGSEGALTPLTPEEGVFNSSLFTPEIALPSAVLSGSEIVKLSFGSSWRDEDVQTATLNAVFDTGVVQIDRWASDPADSDFKDDAPNEALTYEVPFNTIPAGATNVKFEFNLQGNNDWWWAVDNVSVFTGDNPIEDGVLRAIIDRDSGEVKIVNRTGQTVDLRGYSIRSEAGVFDEANANFQASPSNDWLQATQPGGDINDLSEVHLTMDPFETTEEINFGTDVWTKYFVEDADITFNYLIDGSGDQIQGIVEFTGAPGAAFDPIDLNFDDQIDINDWETFKAGFGTPLTGKTLAQRYALGDLDGNAVHSLNDFTEFQRLFDLSNGAGSFQAMLAIPEPTSALTLALGLVGVCLFGRQRLAVPACLLAAAMLFAGDTAQAQLVLLQEDFEDVTLQPFQEEGGGGGPNVWTDVPPTGWSSDNSGVPGIGDPTTDGVSDWSNWAFVDKEAWLSADDQGRSLFERGIGNVAVADPDEWDDADGAAREQIAQPPTPDDLYDVFLTTPVINIPASVPAGRIKLSFDSSWRGNELGDDLDGDNNQRATITAIYGGVRTEVLTWDSDEESDDFNPDAENQQISQLDLDYDGSSTTLQLEFAMTDAWNDWWWAIDNLLVEVPTDPAKLRINTYNGLAYVAGDDVIASSITGIDVVSPSGQLQTISGGLSQTIDEATDGFDPGTTAGDSAGEQWEQLASTSTQFSEAYLFGSSVFDDTRSELIGQLQDAATLDDNAAVAQAASDLQFTYSLATGSLVEGVVEYFYEEVLPGDFNDDGTVDAADYTVWRDNLGTSFSLAGNGDESGGSAGTVDSADYDLWRNNFGLSIPAASVAVPEPSALAALLLGLAAGCCRSARRRMVTVAPVCLMGLLLAGQASAQNLPPSPWVDRDYGFGEGDKKIVNGASVSVVAGDPLSQTDGFGNVVTFDDAGAPGADQLIDLVLDTDTTQAPIQPLYVDTTDRPDGSGDIGLELNPGFLFGNAIQQHYLRTGFGEALNNPEQSPSSIASLINTNTFEPDGRLNYARIDDRGFELWAKPTNVGRGEQHIVMDSAQHGVLIDANGNFAMRYASQFEVTTTQLPGPDEVLGTEDDVLEVSDPVVVPANYATDVAAVDDQWYHLSVVRPFGPDNGSILYVNGVAEAIAFGTYAIETVENLGEGDIFTNINELDTSPLTVGRATSTPEAGTQASFNLPESERFYFQGVVDDLTMFVMGLNDNDNLPGGGDNVLNDFGEYIFQRDNGYAQFAAPLRDGDLDGDGDVTLTDATLFAGNWLAEKSLSAINPFTGEENSRLVGDLTTRGLGDFNYDGIVDLEDWAILNTESSVVGAAAMRLILSVPEPTAFAAVCGLGLFASLGRPQRS